jgi:hypothetical protein
MLSVAVFRYTECCYAECSVFYVILSVVILSVVVPSKRSYKASIYTSIYRPTDLGYAITAVNYAHKCYIVSYTMFYSDGPLTLANPIKHFTVVIYEDKQQASV